MMAYRYTVADAVYEIETRNQAAGIIPAHVAMHCANCDVIFAVSPHGCPACGSEHFLPVDPPARRTFPLDKLSS